MKHGGYNEKHNGFIPLKADYLRRIHEDYKQHMAYLVRQGYLECDGYWVQGVKSKGYRLSDRLALDGYMEQEVTDSILRSTLREQDELQRKERKLSLKPYKHIVDWYLTNDLEIDADGARRWAKNHLDQELMNCNVARAERRAKTDAYNASMWFINKIANKSITELDFSVCEFGGRLHGMFTFHNKELRKFVTYKGQGLVSMDIKNSQPFFSTRLLDTDFWMCSKSSSDRLRLSKINEELYKEIRKEEELYRGITIRKRPEPLTSGGFHTSNFRNSVVGGNIYEAFMSKLHSTLCEQQRIELASRVNDRQAVKREVLRTFYECPTMFTRPFYKPSEVLIGMYPEVFEVFNRIKRNTFFRREQRKQYTLLAKIIQLVESHCVLKGAAKRIAREQPGLPLFTIHDSIVTLDGHQAYVKQVIEEEVNRLVGVTPKLEEERWQMPH
ncbi:hypothetical protein GCM10023184_29410 [Flaviaesturariibacter amylovorans]|uniref:DNA-directed DNA polymerase family A palm domain-containing protein n=2 Tax=Flaviaesturariibacter amylovorans TaxID=1084520 RepID=A0ABP8H687_9BACT